MARWTMWALALLVAFASDVQAASLFDWKDYASADKSVSLFLIPVFGDLFGGEKSAISEGFKVINAICLMVGGVIAAYSLVIGSMKTASNGSMMGEWSDIWLPLRTALGVALTLPVGSGFCLAQFFVAWVALQGVGMADATWKSFVTGHFSSTAQGLAPSGFVPEFRDLAINTLRSRVCVEGYNFKMAQANAEVADSLPGPMSVIGIANTSGTGFSFGLNASLDQTLGQGACGTFDLGDGKISEGAGITGKDEGSERRSAEDLLAAYGKAGAAEAKTGKNADALARSGLYDADGLKRLADEVLTARREVLTGLVNSPDLTRIAKDIALSKDGVVSSENYIAFEGVFLAAERELASRIKSVGASEDLLDGIRANATKDGWLLAGMWFMKASQLQDSIGRIMAIPTVYSGPNAKVLDPLGVNHDPKFYAWLRAAKNISSSGPYGNLRSMDEGARGEMRLAANLSGVLGELGGRNPVMSIKTIGDAILGAMEPAIVDTLKTDHAKLFRSLAGTSVLPGGAKASGKGQGNAASPNESSGTGNVKAFSVILMLVGGTFSVVIPLMPFILFFMAGVAWLVLVIEAVVAAPLFAVWKLAPSGTGVLGNSKQAYMMLLGLFIRPALMVVGFALSLFILDAVLSALLAVFLPAMLMSMGSGVAKVITLALTGGLFFGVTVFLIKEVLGVVTYLPDHMLRWIGSAGESIGTTYGKGGVDAMSEGMEGVGHELIRGALYGKQGHYMNMLANSKTNEVRQFANSPSQKTYDALISSSATQEEINWAKALMKLKNDDNTAATIESKEASARKAEDERIRAAIESEEGKRGKK